MKFYEIKPYIRYIQRLKITRGWAERVLVPRDNRLFFCLNGCGYITLSDKEYEMTRGSLLLIPAGEPYILHIPEGELTYISVNFDYSFTNSDLSLPIGPVSPDEILEKGIIERTCFSDEPLLNSHVYLNHIPGLENILSPMVVTYNKKVLYYELELSGAFIGALSQILRAGKLGDLSRPDSVIDVILSYIHNNYAENLTNAKIGEVFGYNTNYVSDLIKTATNLPLHKYIENVRIERAVDLLTTSELSVGAIAELCGFCDIYHFSKMFKSRLGVSPRAYRKNN